jgi:hypothetical protein
MPNWIEREIKLAFLFGLIVGVACGVWPILAADYEKHPPELIDQIGKTLTRAVDQLERANAVMAVNDTLMILTSEQARVTLEQLKETE